MAPVLIAVGVVLLLVLLWCVGVYNRCVNLRTLIENAWSNIDTELKRRHDLIPNLVAAVQGYAAHEKTVFARVVEARAQAMQPHDTRQAVAEDENQLARAVKTVFAVAESYPQLKANENFLSLQRELANTENRIQAARRFYNGNVKDLNTLVNQFPSNLIAKQFSFQEAEFFELDSPAEAQAVTVKM